LRGLSDVFRYAGQGRRRRSRNADCGRLLNAYFAQAVVGVVVVVLGSTDGLFGLLFNLNFSMLSKSRIIIKL
ncbi:hypothetical protein, partial [Gilliamella apicola]|uniref:hypothetical protein n=1 Tax=Gilliamella apicola TaxID=1196095 RepID=UPI003986B658